MAKPPLLHYISYYSHQNCTINYFPLLRYWIWDISIFFKKGFAHFSLVICSDTNAQRTTETCMFGKKQRKSKNHKRKSSNESFFGIIPSDIRTQVQKDHYCLGMLQMFGKTLRSGYILNLYGHHVISSR